MGRAALRAPAKLRGGSSRPWFRVAVPLVLLAALAAAAPLGGEAGGPSLSAALDVLRAGLATAVLFGACGYTPARTLLSPSLRVHLPLFVLPIGAGFAGLALTLLGTLQVPLAFSVAILVGLGIGSGLFLRLRRGPIEAPRKARDRAGSVYMRLVWPAAIALAIAALIASPQLRGDSLATVLGQNGDAHMATGAAELLQHAPPGAERTELPIDHMPAVWGSKYPIIYVLAGVSTLSGLDPVQSFSTVIAIVAALCMVGLFLVAFHVAGAPAAGALAGLGFLAASRILPNLALEPYYNQIWGLFSLPFVLVFGWRFLWEPSRGTFALLLASGALSVFAYPLLAPFPALFMIVTGVMVWRRRRAAGVPVGWLSALRLPTGRRWLLLWIPAGLVALFPALILAGLAVEKMQGALLAILPGGNLDPWSGSAPGFRSLAWFLGLPESPAWVAAVVVVLALAVVGLRTAPREARMALGAVVLSLAGLALWFELRDAAALFHFRALGFFAPIVLTLAGVGAAQLLGREIGRVPRATLAGVLAVLIAVLALGVRSQVESTLPHAGSEVWELRSWGSELAAGASIRVDVTPTGVQQWAGYMLSEHPLSASDPLRLFFPHPPVGRKADFVVLNSDRPRPADAQGAPLLTNRRFSLYRLDPDLPGRDLSSRRMVDPPLVHAADAG